MSHIVDENKPDIGFWSVFCLTIGSMIGTGIFIFASAVTSLLMNSTLVIFSFILGSIVSLSGAICLGELVAGNPHPGGLYHQFKTAFGPVVGFLFAWTRFFCIRIGTIGLIALAVAGYFCDLMDIPTEITDDIRRPLAVLSICMITFINILGIRSGIKFQIIFTIPKILCLTAIAGLGCIVNILSLSDGDVFIADVFVIPDSVSVFKILSLLLSSMIPVMWSLGGWEDVAGVAGEIKNPEIHMPKAIVIGVLFTSVLYMMVMITYLSLLNPEEMARPENTASITFSKYFGPYWSNAMSAFLICIGLTSLNTTILTGARIPGNAGRDHLVFKWAAKTSTKTSVPQKSLLVQGGGAILLVCLCDDLNALLLWIGTPYWFFSLLLGCACLRLCQYSSKRYNVFPRFIFNLAASIFILFSVCMLIVVSVQNIMYLFVFFVVMLLGLLSYNIQFWIKNRFEQLKGDNKNFSVDKKS